MDHGIVLEELHATVLAPPARRAAD